MMVMVLIMMMTRMMVVMVMVMMMMKVKVKVMIEIEPHQFAPQQTHRLIQKTMSGLPRSNDFSREIRGRFSLLYLYFQDRKPMKCFRKLSDGKR